MPAARFADFIDVILATDPDTVATPAAIPASFVVAQENGIQACYTPFDHVNTAARVVLVGITPGFVHWKNAVRAARQALLAGVPHAEVLHAAKTAGAFSGAIRPNLVAVLDRAGLQRWLGIASCADLFGTHAHLLHVTAVLRHAIFVDGKNYSGASPNMLTTPLLLDQMLDHFAPEAALLPDAVYVPMGPKVGLALSWLARRGVLREERILHGIPHPSGANAERIAYFLGRKDKTTLSNRTNGARIDADRLALAARLAALGMP
ncbi:hypothetical protein HH212_02025 [Massilia forsythiae]|uniref:Uracil-DNA glycosylase n=1 Tax=Massilia forsythiae TaxID=2728020 RepID=A0A7Z2ZSH5_9BURK|nr:hypothetical protein [Massilia forsythiae]QJD98961.1 hypothetical protein HH212_02025 [Massilia forsythiae]